MADYNEDHAAKLKHLYKVAVKQNEKAKALTKRVADLEAAGGQANKIESIKVNGTAQAIGSRQECEHYCSHQDQPAE